MAEEQGIVIKPEKSDALEMYQKDGKPIGMEGYTPSTQFGYLKIDQKTGEIEYTLTGEKRKTWQVVLLTFSFSRIMFEEGMSNPTPICKSKERKQNSLDLEGTVYGACSQCEYSKWNDRQKPPCKLNLNLSGMIEGNVVTPVGITMGGANYKTGENLLNAFFKSRTPMFFKILEVGTEMHTRGANDYYTYTFKEAGSTNEDLRAELAGIYDTYGGLMPVEGVDEPVADEVSQEKTVDKMSDSEIEDILLKDDTKEEEPF